MILALKTDSPVAELYALDQSGERMGKKEWNADRQLAKGLLGQLELFLGEHGLTLQSVQGLVVYRGPGSFTGLRIGLTVANTFAYAQSIPIVGESGENWLHDGVARLQRGNSDGTVLPLYGSEPRITKQRK